jgi:8-oxo-dGTP pyrophosphatase MutT (NUDIX family)
MGAAGRRTAACRRNNANRRAAVQGPTLPGARDAHKRRTAVKRHNFRPIARMRQCSMNQRNSVPEAALAAAFVDYRLRWPEEAGVVEHFVALLHDTSDPFLRERLSGHFTASAWLVTGDGDRVLLTHHRKLDRWLQLGGHADGDRDLARAALREAGEESGLAGLEVVPGIFDLDRHWIPEHGGVPAHWHYDVRYVVRASADESFSVSDESHALAWRGVAALAVDASADASLRRMAGKWLDGGPVAPPQPGLRLQPASGRT